MEKKNGNLTDEPRQSTEPVVITERANGVEETDYTNQIKRMNESEIVLKSIDYSSFFTISPVFLRMLSSGTRPLTLQVG